MQNTKSVIDIEVNDDQFKQFHELFLKYQKVLGQSPQLWKDVEKGIDRATDAVNKQTDAVDKGTDAVDRQTDAVDKQTDAIDRQTDKRKQEDQRREDALNLEGRKIDENAQKQEQADTAHLGNMRELAAALMAHHEMMLDIAREEKRQNAMRDEAAKKQERDEKRINDLHKERVKTAKDFAGTLGSLIGSTASIGLNIAKWGLGLGVGLIGGGFFGMDRLGAGATGERSRARGLGVSAGELRAWQTDVGNYIDPSGLLGAASNAYADPNQRALFQRAGVGADVIRSGNTSQISEQALRGLISFYNQNQGPNAAQSWSARGFDQLVSFGDIRRIAAAPAAERERMFGALQRDTRNLNTSDRTMSAWQDFYTQLQRSGQVLKSTFLDGLVNLTGPLKELSSNLVDLVRSFMGSDGFRELITTVSDGFKYLADSMKDGSFNNAVHTFIVGVKSLADSLGAFMPSNTPAAQKDAQSGGHWKSGAIMGGAMGAAAGSIVPGVGTLAGGALGAGLGALSGGIYDLGNVDYSGILRGMFLPSEAHADTIGMVNSRRYLEAIAQTESHGDPNAVSHAGALGMFQLMPATAREYGVSDPFNPQQAAQGAGLYIQALNQMFQGDMLKTTAAYNAGQGRVQKAVKKYGGDWFAHMPSETQQYVGRVAANYRAGNFNVNIQNATGGGGNSHGSNGRRVMSVTSVLSTAGRDIFDLAYRISPIVLVDGIASEIIGGVLPIVALTESIGFVNGVLTGASVANLDNFWAHFDVAPGGTLINNAIGQYPFANQSVAANAIIQNPLNLSVVMHCPMRGAGAAVSKLSTLMALQAALDLHNNMGGTYTIATPGYLYTNMIMQTMRDISQGNAGQPQSMFQFDFIRPLTQINELQQVKSTLMKKLTSGGQTGTSWGATGTGNPFSSVMGDLFFMTTYIQFTPNNDATPPFSFNCTLDGDVYEIQLWWNVYGQRWYINCYDTNGTRIRTEPLIGSPDSGDIPMLPGLFSENTLVYRESSNNFEVS